MPQNVNRDFRLEQQTDCPPTVWTGMRRSFSVAHLAHRPQVSQVEDTAFRKLNPLQQGLTNLTISKTQLQAFPDIKLDLLEYLEVHGNVT
jgi:hypothetical protein